MTSMVNLAVSQTRETLSLRSAAEGGVMPSETQTRWAFSRALEAARQSPPREKPGSLQVQAELSSEGEQTRSPLDAEITITNTGAPGQPKVTQSVESFTPPADAVPMEQALEPEAAEPGEDSQQMIPQVIPQATEQVTEQVTGDVDAGHTVTETADLPVAAPRSELQNPPSDQNPQRSPEEGPVPNHMGPLPVSAGTAPGSSTATPASSTTTPATAVQAFSAGPVSTAPPVAAAPLVSTAPPVAAAPAVSAPVISKQAADSTKPVSVFLQNTTVEITHADTASAAETIGVPEHSGSPRSGGLGALESQQTQTSPLGATAPASAPGAAAQPLPLSNPAVVSTPASASVAPQGPHSSPAPPLHTQLSGPVAQLVSGTNGEKYLTVNVAPENLGPVTVRANITNDTMRIELFAPQDAGREALRGVLQDLRRDLAGLGLGAGQVSLGEGEAPSSSAGQGQGRGEAAFGERPRDPSAAQTRGEDAAVTDREAEQRGDQAGEHQRDRYGFAIAGPLSDETAPHAPAMRSVGLDLLA